MPAQRLARCGAACGSEGARPAARPEPTGAAAGLAAQRGQAAGQVGVARGWRAQGKGARDQLLQDWLRNEGRLQNKCLSGPETERSCTPRVSLSLMFNMMSHVQCHLKLLNPLPTMCRVCVCCRAAGQLARECERLLRDKAALKAQLR